MKKANYSERNKVGSMSKYDLLANPFAVVGVSVGANRASIGETIDDALFEDDSPARQRELDNARQSLFAPRARQIGRAHV